MDLYLALRRLSDKSPDDMAELYSLLSDQPDFENRLIESLNGDEEIHRVATWLIKHHLEHTRSLAEEQVAHVLDQLAHLKNWEAKLHILQCLPYVLIPSAYKNAVEEFVRGGLIEINKFVRAWAYNGFYELACQYPELQPEAEALFEAASEDEAASVKARVKNLQKQGFSTTLNQAS